MAALHENPATAFDVDPDTFVPAAGGSVTLQRHVRNPMIDPALYTPSKQMRFMTSALAMTSSGSFLVSKNPVTSQSRLPAPVLEAMPTTIAQPDWTSLQLSDQDLEGMSKHQHLEATKKNVFCERQSQALHAKENKKKSGRAVLLMGGLGRHLTDPEWITKTREFQEARDAEAVAKVQRAEGQEAAKIARETHTKEWEDIKVVHEAAVAMWERDCAARREVGCRAKDLLKKPVRPKKPKAPVVEEPPTGAVVDESSSDDED
ncbi:hypothetical protein DFH08DRAFT_816824 [Mycena albidolilacea]|uniref:Uncharacterized protein n=1 Tax=Mycena albidolilacea TaxID=1033008 RepID=A0AAD6ZJN4_9AGAR|nr:hypothetical protein DFH08DRAFT_816824 [Mycena albidolilacea]